MSAEYSSSFGIASDRILHDSVRLGSPRGTRLRRLEPRAITTDTRLDSITSDGLLTVHIAPKSAA
ncbi:hypothetical protein [Stutzerimonas nitrititolerans]|uniref:hypothetical protein n=1 Tax=Stutzerimonas nitrititolerans TaxID=2482751 RepID=UPI0009E84EC1|nr:hypothetical protein [Stutzerimonas nitrititolerans]